MAAVLRGGPRAGDGHSTLVPSRDHAGRSLRGADLNAVLYAQCGRVVFVLPSLVAKGAGFYDEGRFHCQQILCLLMFQCQIFNESHYSSDNSVMVFVRVICFELC